jgi:hypothetical protein
MIMYYIVSPIYLMNKIFFFPKEMLENTFEVKMH